jgi:hypothetical protein
VTGTNLYHVGVLVTDLDEAMERFGLVLGLTFGEPRHLHLTDMVDDGEQVERHLHVVYSNEGPPYLELIEAQSEGIWGHQHGEGMHHVGSWQPGLEDKLRELAEAGVPATTTVSIDGTLIAAYLDPAPVHATRIELVGPREERADPT